MIQKELMLHFLRKLRKLREHVLQNTLLLSHQLSILLSRMVNTEYGSTR